jgi:hypothetical protein
VVRFVGGRTLGVLQGPRVAAARIEQGHGARSHLVSLTDAAGRAAYVSPQAIICLVPGESDWTSHASMAEHVAKARVHFADGAALDILQGAATASKRFEEAGATEGLFAYLTAEAPVLINRLAVTHVTADPR